MTEEEFLRSLEQLLAACPAYVIDRIEQRGDIVLRRKATPSDTARAQNMALAFQSLMRADPKKPRGGGWL